ISAVSFDPVSDVLWAGNEVGQVCAYYRNRMRGVAFTVGEGYVSSLSISDQHIYAMSIAGQGLGAWSRGGVNNTPANTSISTFTNRASTLIAVSNKAEFLALNTSTGKIIRQVPCPPQVVVLHASHSLILSGSSDGFIRTHDFRTSMKRNSGSENMIRAHQGSVRAINSSGNWIYTIGWNIRYSVSPAAK
ncbi:12220_t:CDS:2, partial [Acaulospora colombiana]